MQGRSEVTGTDLAAWRVDWALSDRDLPLLDLAAGIRPDSLSGFREMTAAGYPGVTKARYAVRPDPGGHVTAWLVLRMTDRYMQQVVVAIRGRLEE